METVRTDQMMDQDQAPYWLLVEDDPQVSMALARFLGQYAPVRHATSVGEARTLLTSLHRCCGLVLDVNLPDGSGLDVLQEIRDRKVQTPALVVTAFSRHENISRAQMLGAQFLWKPWSRDNLEAFVSQTVGRPSFRQDFERCVNLLRERTHLSPRETELVRHATSGVPLKELPSVMSISANSVKTLVRRILNKTGAGSIQEIARQLHQQMLGPSGGPGVDDLARQ